MGSCSAFSFLARATRLDDARCNIGTFSCSSANKWELACFAPELMATFSR